jgi:hypothetical protein
VKPPAYLGAMDRLNPLVVAVLHAPVLHWLASPGLATITLNGRHSGRRVRFPVGYHDQRDAVLILVSNAGDRRWWRNFREPWPAELHVRGRTRQLMGEVLEAGTDVYRERVGRAFSRASFIPRMFGVDFDRDSGLTSGQMLALGEHAAVVRFRDEDAR